MTLTNERLDELAAMEQAATSGPWEDKQMSCQTERHTYRCEVIAASKGPSNRMADLLVPEDARFIAASRNEFAAMIEQCKEANRLRELLVRLADSAERFAVGPGPSDATRNIFWDALYNAKAALKGPTP